MRRALSIGGALGLIIISGVAWWRRHPRAGSAWVNRVVDPWLVRNGVIESSRGEIGLLEHVGRTTGTVRVTPIHPVPTTDGFRIIAPVGVESQWAKNVVAAGHCRLQVGSVVHELDEPRLVLPSEVEGLPRPATRLMDWLGFRYVVLRRFAKHEGTLGTVEGTKEAAPKAAPETAPVEVAATA
ncbi:MAG TPA: nitroreductase/quinone reductase family protein [Candidatus Limnocylindrales bacterium]|nr:nitroreductase/quinone reductase family protein [Candidatus Limnocylindrales bacterium]